MKSSKSLEKLFLITRACDVVLNSVWKEGHQWSTVLEK
jgi:hypothetical protein